MIKQHPSIQQNISLDKDITSGEFVSIGNKVYYKITNVDTMPPFFMSIVSHSNHWLFLSSNGGITAGRKDCDMSLFPYTTDDKIIENADNTGATTVLRVYKNKETFLWECFSQKEPQRYTLTRNLYKGIDGNSIIFEEINHQLQLAFSYSWQPSDRFGFVRHARLQNLGKEDVELEVLDGILNIMPAAVPYSLQNASSNLVGAYKRTELHANGLATFALSAVIVDRAEPSEALLANTVWSTGLNPQAYLLSNKQISLFKNGLSVQSETDLQGEKGAYLTVWKGNIVARTEKEWFTVAEVHQSISKVISLQNILGKQKELKQQIIASLQEDSKQLRALVATADGLQSTGDKQADIRHFSNTLFNMMRGGVFNWNYQIEKTDYQQYLSNASILLANDYKEFLLSLPEEVSLDALLQEVSKFEDSNLFRLTIEYLPLKFSRRHGDPSRPWNKFSIRTKDEFTGEKILYYEGNWRDIFQNWEALAFSYPLFSMGMVFKFLNASTFDGYNPYRVTKDGFDWETIEPNDPWSYIGYWGDHQIIYLLKLLEFLRACQPTLLDSYMHEKLFVYAQVPYKIKTYEALVLNPKDTIVLDQVLEEEINARKQDKGADGALLHAPDGHITKANLVEKILASLLAKLSNFIPETGIWMNTQRPEWNDANNALVGNGVSMVTLYYLRRFLNFFLELWETKKDADVTIAKELGHYFYQLKNVFEDHSKLLGKEIDPNQKKSFLDRVGQAASAYRESVYAHGFSKQQMELSVEELLSFFQTAVDFIEDTIVKNQRADGLYHAYNLIQFKDNQIEVSYLDEMLEGQVAVLSAGYLSALESVQLLDTLRQSALYRPDQNSYMLYPNKKLPGFLQKNIIAPEAIEESALLQQLVQNGNQQIVIKDQNGQFHFNADFKNATFLSAALEQLPEEYHGLLQQDKAKVEAIYEQVFNHKAFTGRSGTFYGYEGLGSIYWHMVSKLLLAVQEVYWRASKMQEDKAVLERLEQHLQEIEVGIGAHKSPSTYGAFPTDPYSHTPFNKGVQQPGMTGQVKEDILTRFGRLGLEVNNAKMHFKPNLLQSKDFLIQATSFTYLDVSGNEETISIAPNSLVYTYCQVPVVYQQGKRNEIKVHHTNGEITVLDSLQLDVAHSKAIWGRTTQIKKVVVKFQIR
ncbi:MAG: hypothetical protein OIF50_01065 [Flavobacteriaceae bacterium]|nr:hypothetical protein [Flavobacteriaceae bacterium]